ncbi:MAG: hypothetical protein C4551_07670 [Bacillota bacterium]|nr:MAG: hypothetical protein C4551_07670 [Bacillota bacterium]
MHGWTGGRDLRRAGRWGTGMLAPEGLRGEVEGLSAGIATIRRVNTSQGLVALTFDDGPSPTLTAAKLRILGDYGGSATFFVVGKLVHQNPEAVRSVVSAGSELANHSYDHAWLTRVGYAGVLRQLELTRRAMVEAGAEQTDLFRPPYGDFSATVLGGAATAGYSHNVLWDVDPQDWRSPPASSIAGHVLSRTSPGSIVVLHDGVEQTVRALPVILARLAARGLKCVAVSKLLAAASPADEPSPPGPTPAPGSPLAECRTLAVTTPFMSGPDVVAVQQALAGQGIDPGPADGVYGPRTAQAVRVFQTRERLAVNGIVTKEVYARLRIECPPG